MVVERHRRDTRSRKHYKHHNRRCHFQGQVRDDDRSNVALSTCDGIVSINIINNKYLLKTESISLKELIEMNSQISSEIHS